MSDVDHQGRKAARAELVTRAFVVFISVALICTLGLLVVLTVQNFQRGKDNRSTLTTIQSCTTPGEDCYERSRKATAAAVGQINRVVILAAACAAQHPGQSTAQIQACVIDGLAKEPK